jgi:exopolyphosphatase/guanosine-5'-triphosphate,3'-diphosphate pyrophosphatase
MARVLAAADIGSNTAHMLLAATDGYLVTRLDNRNEWIPLGETVSRKGVIPDEIVEQLVLALKEFRRVASNQRAEGFYVFATEGMRMAANHGEVLGHLKSETGIEVDLISPRREAELSFLGISLDTRHVDATLLFEVGGGSAQIAEIDDGALTDQISLPLGTGRVIATAGLRNPCPPTEFKLAENYVKRQLRHCSIRQQGGAAVLSGGVGRGLWRALHPDGEKLLAIDELRYMEWSASRLTIDRLVHRFDVKTKRAGTLLPGALIYRCLMEHFDLEEVFVSEFGVREGAILEMAQGKVKSCLV